VGTTYSIYNLETNEYLTTIPEFYGVVEILESPLENYHLLTQKRLKCIATIHFKKKPLNVVFFLH